MAPVIESGSGSAPKRGQTKSALTDEVVPMHLFDDIAGYHNLLLGWTVRFDEVLDANKLKDALWQLLELDGWRKLGGRLHKTKSGKVEIHIPRPFTAERPPTRFSHADENMRMAEHPVASKLPRATGKLETYPSPRYFKSLSLGPGAPVKFEDYLKGDEPQLSLRVVNFVDGTLVSLTFMHTFADIGGFISFLKGWSLALAGKLDQVEPFLGVHDDPMAGLYNSEPSTPYLLADRQLSGWRMTAWGVRFMLESLCSSPVESRTICLPKEHLMALRKKAKGDIAKSVGQGDGGQPFVSDGDIITALVSRMACEELTRPSKRSVTTILAVDARSRAPGLFRKEAAYVQNAAVGAFSFGSALEILQTPLGELALKYRKDLAAQAQLDQMIGLCRLNRQSLKKTGNGIMFGDTSSVLAMVSNWSKSRCFEIVDFSPAITIPSNRAASADASAEKRGKPGHPVYWHLQGLIEPKFSPTVFAVLGEDPEGNLWLTGDLRSSTWAIFKDYMNKVVLEGDSGRDDPKTSPATDAFGDATSGRPPLVRSRL